MVIGMPIIVLRLPVMKKLTLAIALSLAAMTSAYKWPDDGMHRYNTDFIIGKSNFADTIPVIFSGNQLYVPVFINGKRHLFNLDTGSSQGIAYIGSDIKFGETLGKIQSKDANGRVDTVPVVNFPEMRLGFQHGLLIKGYVGSLVSRPGKHYFYDGVIGFDLINKGLTVKIDIRAGQMILTDRKNFFGDEKGLKLKYKLQRWTPYVTSIPFLDVKAPTLFDTGMSDFYVINKSLFDKYRVKDPRVPMMVEETTYDSNTLGVYGAEKKSLMFYINFPSIKVGEAVFTNVHGYTTQGDTKLGGALLGYGSLIIDGKRKAIWFKPYETLQTVEVKNKINDIALTDLDGKVIVTTIRHRSDLYRNGLREGDIILKVNGKGISSSAEVSLGEGTKIIAHDSRGFNKEVTL